MREPIRETRFVPGWMDMGPKIPVPKIDWISEKKLDVSYGEHRLQKMDIYYPNDRKKDSYPVVILVHGGGFTHCDKRDWHLYPGFFALERGFVLASVNYRLAPEVSYPALTEDLKSAIVFLRSNAEKFDLDPDNIFLYGTSAGGNMVSLVGLEGNASKGSGRDFHVNAVAALCPAINFPRWLKRVPWYLKLLPEVRRTIRGYLGGNPTRNPELAIRASADTRITGDWPAFYIQHGDQDPLIPVEQAVDFARALRDQGALGEKDLVLDVLKGAAHAGGGPDFLEPEHILPILGFFENHITSNSGMDGGGV